MFIKECFAGAVQQIRNCADVYDHVGHYWSAHCQSCATCGLLDHRDRYGSILFTHLCFTSHCSPLVYDLNLSVMENVMIYTKNHYSSPT